LYNELRNYSPSIWGNLPSQIDKSFEQNFENAMKSVIIELALQSQDLVAEYFLEDTADITYLKLHGSCNFVLKSVGTWTNSKFQGANAIESGLTALNADEVVPYCNSNDSLSSAMCVYMDSKPSQFGYRRIKAFQERWKKLRKVYASMYTYMQMIRKQ